MYLSLLVEDGVRSSFLSIYQCVFPLLFYPPVCISVLSLTRHLCSWTRCPHCASFLITPLLFPSILSWTTNPSRSHYLSYNRQYGAKHKYVTMDTAEENGTANTGVLSHQRFENIRWINFSGSQDERNNPVEVGVKVALHGQFDNKGYTVLLVILTIATPTGILILIDTRVSVMVPLNNGQWYARHILTFPAERATCPARPVQYRAIQKETGQHDIKVQHSPMMGKRGHKCASQQANR
jgi:hypothetical protein